ncbi:hypothetical protein B0J13DRAFT_525070 [Dactylonectria estremocensis]|uniref:Ubiquitin-like protease family profile domain-containing protein n=1 Tax=Dactylonectria estremocensis TaxID=1079267 RepID=A0A9P9EUU7_9HYPO|nr:hypothetical protein B0J13DRAFT_525070 [Dactylonectria estremocensis]
MPRPWTSLRKNAEPDGTVGGSTTSPALEPLLREGSVGHVSSDASVVRQYSCFLDKEWGREQWRPPRSWHRGAGKDVVVTNADVCNIRAMTIIAQHRRDKFASLTVLYGRLEYGFIRAAATPAGSTVATWKLSTSTRALNLMRQHFAAELVVQVQAPGPLSPKTPVRSTAPWNQNSSGVTADARPPLSIVPPSESTHTVDNPPRIGPGEGDDFAPGLRQTALEQLGNPEQLLDANVINFLQNRFKSNTLGDTNLIHPDYFRSLLSPRPRTAADHANTDKVVNGIRQRKESISAILHNWDRGHWTLASFWPDEDAKTLTVQHYDPAHTRTAYPRGEFLKTKFKAWVQANFDGWKLVWSPIVGPRNCPSVRSGIFVILGMIEWLNNKKIHPESWQGSKARDVLQRQFAQLDEQSASRNLVQGEVQTPRRGYCSHDTPGGNDSPQLSDSPVTPDSGVFCHRSDNSPRTPSDQETHETFPDRLLIRQSSPITPTAEDSPRTKRRVHWASDPPSPVEEPEPLSKKTCLRQSSPAKELGPPSKETGRRQSMTMVFTNALVELQEMSSRFKEIRKILSELDFDELSRESLATDCELKEQIEMLSGIVENQDRLFEKELQKHTVAEQGKASLDSLRQQYHVRQRPEIPANVPEESRNAIAEVMDETMFAAEHVIIKKTEAQSKLAQEAADKMKQAKIKGDEARELVLTKGQLHSEVQENILAIAKVLLFEGVGEDVCDALEKGLKLDRGRCARSALTGMLRERAKGRVSVRQSDIREETGKPGKIPEEMQGKTVSRDRGVCGCTDVLGAPSASRRLAVRLSSQSRGMDHGWCDGDVRRCVIGAENKEQEEGGKGLVRSTERDMVRLQAADGWVIERGGQREHWQHNLEG